jgi:hypothetical protein
MRIGYDGQGDGNGRGLICGQDGDDLAGRVRAHDAGNSG